MTFLCSSFALADRKGHALKVYHPRDYTADRPWGAIDIERLKDATVRLHWTDQPYVWHVNDGPEVFAVLDGSVDMHVRGPDGERSYRLEKGDVFHAIEGDEHKAAPIGQARILVVERAGSI
jgi:mannose-6-phosphate isomerase-like protein (cupin superfamily)